MENDILFDFFKFNLSIRQLILVGSNNLNNM